MKRSINKIVSIFILISIIISSMPLGTINAYVRPSVGVSRPSKTTVNVGDSVSYTIMYSDADEIYLSSSYVTLNGFSANVYVSGNGDTRTVTLSNIQGTSGNKSISIKANSAENDAGYAYATPNSYAFNLVSNNDNIKPSIAVSSPSTSTVNAGGSVSYTISFSDNVGISKINTTSSYITLNGFSANVSVSNIGSKSVVTLSNIQGSNGNKSISIKAGAAYDNAGNTTSAINSTASFNLVNNTANNNQNNNSYVDNVRPSISISSPNNKQINVGGTVVYTVKFADNNSVAKINLSSSYITLNGFTANVLVSGSGNTRMITLSNIQGTSGSKSISIKAGAAQDSVGNSTYSISSEKFSIIQKINSTTSTVTKPTNNKVNSNINKNNTNLVISSNIATIKASTVLKSTPKITSTCNDNLGVLGDINKNLNEFSTWLSNERENTTSVSQNNLVAKNQKVTYFVDYYNGAKDAEKNVKIRLTIPYNVDVLEINSDGYIKTQTAEETVIEWSKSSIQSKAKCRLYVKVKYLANTLLENSDKISEQFYVSLKTENGSKSETTYLRQLFVDTNANKKATIGKYLFSIDNTNSIRPDDKITRAELAKLLVDSGVIALKHGNNDYTKYKDAEEIPTYAREYVSTLYNTDIIETFSDSEFKPNNPIVRDEFFRIIAKASEYMSNGKLKVNEPTFIYTDAVNDKDKSLNDNTKYIMELIRQNILSNKNTTPDEYILRKDAVEIINALTFRGPYKVNFENNKIKFIDIDKDSKYFYNIMGAASAYTYNYSESLEQQILEIK